MIARAVLSLITEAYSDEFLAKAPEHLRKELESVVKRAGTIFHRQNQLNWFLKASSMEDLVLIGHNQLNLFQHLFSLPIEAIHNFSFGSLSYKEAKERLQGLEAQWQERQSRLIPIEDAYNSYSYMYAGDEYWDEESEGYEHETEVEGTPEDIVVFPDGFRWVNLNVPYSEIEAKAMGHCGNEPRQHEDDTLLSLRQLVVQGDKKYLMPHATFVLMSNGYLRELKGFQNHKLAPKYMPYVVELFKQYDDIFGIDNTESYRPESDVTWDDFTSEQLQEIIRSNPNLGGEVRYKATGEDGIYDTRYGKMIVSDGGNTVRKEYRDGKIEYFNREGQLHRDDGPAIEYASGTNKWYRNGELHRDDGPAVEWSDGTKEWWVNGKRHRDDGPAVEKVDGTEYWYRNGKLHRDDGPAFIERYGYEGWYRVWYRNDKKHRDDGPAFIYPDGTKHWYRNGELHRDDGPAFISIYGKKEWYRNNTQFEPTDEEVARYEERIRRGEITE